MTGTWNWGFIYFISVINMLRLATTFGLIRLKMFKVPYERNYVLFKTVFLIIPLWSQPSYFLL